MINNKRVLAVIPARGGSKGLPKKNIKLLNGLPLIEWTIKTALKSKLIDQIIVSTDSEEIASVAESAGISVPWLRPAKYAEDKSPSYEAILHGMEQLEKNNNFFDYVALLEPTSPLRKKDDIDKAISKILENTEFDSLVSVGEVHTEHPLIVKKINDEGKVVPYIDKNIEAIYQRQQADKAYFPYGVIYICKSDIYKSDRTFYTPKTLPFHIERWQNYEIDDEIDFLIVEKLIEKYIGEING